jgi:hypothetical protein
LFARMMEMQSAIWDGKAFDPHQTALFMTHKMRAGWEWSRSSRMFNNPHFVYPEDKEDQNLRNELAIGETAWDEIESDEFLTIISDKLLRFLKGKRIAKVREAWNTLTKRGRIEEYNTVRKNTHLLNGVGFLEFDELMRIEPSQFRGYTVKFDFDPFGQRHNEKNIYRRNKPKLFVAVKPWFSTGDRIAFLTTERLASEVVAAAFQAKGRPLTQKIVPSPFCVPVPVQLDYRANKNHIQDLVRELQASGDEVVISDMTKGMAVTPQRAKGHNGFADRDVTIILTHLSTDHYAGLNVIGQVIGKPAVAIYYEDLIIQGIGRNTGFRGTGRRVRIICTRRLWHSTLSILSSDQFTLTISDPAIQAVLGDRQDVSVQELLNELSLDVTQLNRERIADYLIATGYEHYQKRKGDDLEWRYRLKGTYAEQRAKTEGERKQAFKENPKSVNETNVVLPPNLLLEEGVTLDPPCFPAAQNTCPSAIYLLLPNDVSISDAEKTWTRYEGRTEYYGRHQVHKPVPPSDDEIERWMTIMNC